MCSAFQDDLSQRALDDSALALPSAACHAADNPSPDERPGIYSSADLGVMRSIVADVCAELGVSEHGALREEIARAVLTHVRSNGAERSQIRDLVSAEAKKKFNRR